MSSFMKEDTSVVPTGPSQPKPSSWIVPSSSSSTSTSSTAAASRDLFASRSLSTSVAIPSGHSSSSPAEPLYMPEDEPFPTERRASDTAMEQGKRGSRELKKAKSTVSRTLPKGLGENAGPFSPTEVNQLARFLNKSPFDDRFNDYQADDAGYPTKKRSSSGFFTNRDSFSEFDDLGQDLSMDEDLRPHRPPPPSGFGGFKRIDNSRSVPDLRSVGSSSSSGGGW